MSTYKECARLIASQCYKLAKRGFVATGQLPAGVAARIEELVNQIAQLHRPDLLKMVDEVLAV